MDHKFTAALVALAVSADPASMHLEELARECEPNSESALTEPILRIGLSKKFKNHREAIRWDADSGIAHSHHNLLPFSPRSEGDAPARFGVLRRIAKHVPEDLYETQRIASHSQAPIRAIDGQPVAALLHQWSDRFDGGFD